jgi:hypothetical protein
MTDATPATAGLTDNAAGLAAIRAHDPGFDEVAFRAEARHAFIHVERALAEHRPELSRPVLADALWDGHRARIEALGPAPVTPTAPPDPRDPHIVGVQRDTAYDTIVVRFDDEDPATMASHRARWYFQRSAAATTSADAAGVDRHCPSCGAPLSLALTITKLVNPFAFADHLTTPLTGTVTWTCSITA